MSLEQYWSRYLNMLRGEQIHKAFFGINPEPIREKDKIEEGDWVRVEPVESIQYKKEKEEMSRDNDIAKKEYKLRYKQVKGFSVKDLEEAGACETAVLKILKDRQCLYETPFRYGYWNDDREQYFNQDFNGVNGLVWLEKHGFIQKLEPEYIYAKDLKYGEYAVIVGDIYKDTLVCKPYDTDKLISVVDPLLTWSDPSCKVKSVDKNKVEVSYRFKD